MRYPREIALVTLFALFAAGLAPAVMAQPRPLDDPIPETIQKGDLVVGVEEFVRFPRTIESNSESASTNPAYARLQYLVPIPDGSGRLVVNDLRLSLIHI